MASRIANPLLYGLVCQWCSIVTEILRRSPPRNKYWWTESGLGSKKKPQSWILNRSVRIPMCVLFTNAVLSFPIPNSNKIISEKLEVCVCVRGKQVSFFHSYSERVMLPAGSWWCYNTVLLSPPPPSPPPNKYYAISTWWGAVYRWLLPPKAAKLSF